MVTKKEDTPERLSRRKYEEKNKEKRRQANVMGYFQSRQKHNCKIYMLSNLFLPLTKYNNGSIIILV